jgi:hypothetical protein
MRIGELARLSVMRPDTALREPRPLSRPSRTDAGYRGHTQESAAQLRLIRSRPTGSASRSERSAK